MVSQSLVDVPCRDPGEEEEVGWGPGGADGGGLRGRGVGTAMMAEMVAGGRKKGARKRGCGSTRSTHSWPDEKAASNRHREKRRELL